MNYTLLMFLAFAILSHSPRKVNVVAAHGCVEAYYCYDMRLPKLRTDALFLLTDALELKPRVMEPIRKLGEEARLPSPSLSNTQGYRRQRSGFS